MNVVLDEQHPADLNVYSKAANVEHSVDLLIDLCEHIVCVVLN